MKTKQQTFFTPPVPECLSQFTAQIRARYERLWTLIEEAIEAKVLQLIPQASTEAQGGSASIDPAAAIRLLESAARSLARAQESRTKLLAFIFGAEGDPADQPAPEQSVPCESPQPSAQQPAHLSPAQSKIVDNRGVIADIIKQGDDGRIDNKLSHNIRPLEQVLPAPLPTSKTKIVPASKPSVPQAWQFPDRKLPFAALAANRKPDLPLLSGLSGSYAQLRELVTVPI